MGDTTPDLRVGDRERRAVDDRLLAAVGDGVLTLHEYEERSGVLWRARTRSELDTLVADLPPPATATLPVPTGKLPPKRVVAVLSEDRTTGPLVAGQDVHGYAVLGRAVVDLRSPDLADGTRVQVRSVLGDVEVQVPSGAVVHLTGLSVLGDRAVAVPDDGRGPVVHVDAVAVLGSVHVTSGAAPAATTAGAATTPGAATAALPVQRHPHLPTSHRGAHGSGLRALLRRAGGLLVPAAVLGGVLLAGPDSAAVFGSDVVRVQDGDDRVAVSTLFGSVQVVVPDDASVTTRGLVVFGSTECEAACGSAGDEAVQVRRLGAFGSVEILTEGEWRREQAEDAREDRLEEAEERREDRLEEAEERREEAED